MKREWFVDVWGIIDNWFEKVKCRKVIGIGCMRYFSIIFRKFKNGFQIGVFKGLWGFNIVFE